MNFVVWVYVPSQRIWSDVGFGYADDFAQIDEVIECNVAATERYEIEINGCRLPAAYRM